MSKLPPLTGKQFIVLLKKLGFELVRIRGSHYRFHGPRGQIVIVPLHSDRQIAKGTLHYAVTEMMGMSVDEFSRLCRKVK